MIAFQIKKKKKPFCTKLLPNVKSINIIFNSIFPVLLYIVSRLAVVNNKNMTICIAINYHDTALKHNLRETMSLETIKSKALCYKYYSNRRTTIFLLNASLKKKASLLQGEYFCRFLFDAITQQRITALYLIHSILCGAKLNCSLALVFRSKQNIRIFNTFFNICRIYTRL